MIAFPDSSSGYYSQGLRVFVQPTGRIVAGGVFSQATADGQITGVAMVGLTTGGTLDAGFGNGGIVTDWRSDASTTFRDALMYGDGSTLRISQVLRLPVGSSTVRAVRLAANGAEDGVFASNVSIGPCCFGFFAARPVQIALRADGKILALITDQGEYFLYRLNADGTRDTTFGANGVRGIVFNRIASPAIVQMIALNDGKILLVGNDPADQSSFFMARLTETANWDKTFGRVGFARVPFGPGLTGSVNNALLQSDGKILLSGSIADPDADVWMMRFRTNGRADSSFGTGGRVTRDFLPGGTDTASAAALSPDGKIRLVGSIGSPANFLVARFGADGGFEEHISIEFTAGQYARGYDVAIQPDGKILVIGDTKNPSPSTTGSMFAVARLSE